MIDTSAYPLIGETANSRYFEVARDVMLVIPHAGARDTGATAQENVAFQAAHLGPRGGGVVVIMMDNMVDQDREARRMYQTGSDPSWMRGTALVGGSMLTRAIAAFFLGVSRPRTPLKMFGTLDAALAWARALNQEKP